MESISVFQEVYRRVLADIVSGRLAGGSRPDERELAKYYRININMARRVIQQLKVQKLIFLDQDGRARVTRDESSLEACRQAVFDQMADDFFQDLREIGIGRAEAIDRIIKKGQKRYTEAES